MLWIQWPGDNWLPAARSGAAVRNRREPTWIPSEEDMDTDPPIWLLLAVSSATGHGQRQVILLSVLQSSRLYPPARSNCRRHSISSPGVYPSFAHVTRPPASTITATGWPRTP